MAYEYYKAYMKRQPRTLTLAVIVILLSFSLTSMSSWSNTEVSNLQQANEISNLLSVHEFEYANDFGFSHDGQYFYVFDHIEESIAVWQTEPREFLFKKSIEGLHCKSSVMEHLSGIGFSPDNQWVIAFDHKKQSAKAWTLPEGNEVDISAWSTSAIYGALFAHDVFPADDDHLLLFGYHDLMHLISFNRLLSETKDETEFSEWTLFREPGNYIAQGFQLDEGDEYEKAILSPDGGHAVFVSTDGYLIRFNCETGQMAGPIQEIDYSVKDLLYTPDGEHIVALNDNNGVFIYDKELQPTIDSGAFEFIISHLSIKSSVNKN